VPFTSGNGIEHSLAGFTNIKSELDIGVSSIHCIVPVVRNWISLLVIRFKTSVIHAINELGNR